VVDWSNGFQLPSAIRVQWLKAKRIDVTALYIYEKSLIDLLRMADGVVVL
jgi:hypothetical protein